MSLGWLNITRSMLAGVLEPPKIDKCPKDINKENSNGL